MQTPPGTHAMRRTVLVTVAVSAAAWMLLSSTAPFLPVRWFVTLMHEAGHAIAAEAVGADVATVTINRHGGGLTVFRSGSISTGARLLVASAGYLGAALIGGLMLELAGRLRNGRVAAAALATFVIAVGLAWVPLRFRPPAAAALTSGSSAGDGRFTIGYCIAVVVFLAAVAIQPWARLRVCVVAAIATSLCLASIDDLRQVFDISTRGGHSDAASAAAVTPLPSWLWAAIWFVVGVIAGALGVWSLVRARPAPRAELGTVGPPPPL
jgi:hypothetical protein